MRKFKLTAILLSAVLAAGLMTGCTSESDEKVTATSIESTEDAGESSEEVLDPAAIDLSRYTKTEEEEIYEPDNSELVWLVTDGVMEEAGIGDIQVGDMLVLYLDGEKLVLKGYEYDVLRYLLLHAGNVMSTPLTAFYIKNSGYFP